MKTRGWIVAPGSLARDLALGMIVAASAFLPSTALLAQSAMQAQQVAPILPIEIGRPVSGRFPVSTPETETTPFQDYRLRLEAGQAVRIKLDSPDPAAIAGQAEPPPGFDPYLELMAEESQEPLASDDDSGEGLNARMNFIAPDSANYIVRARPLSMVREGQDPTYTLIVEEVPPPPTPREFSGSRVEGDLGAGSPEDETFEPVRYDAYWFSGQEGERIQFEMISSEPGGSVMILDESDGVLNANGSYDQTSVRVITVLPRTGRYLVRAQVPTTQTAHYTLELTRATEPEDVGVEEIAVGESKTGQFTLRSNASPAADGSGQIEFFYQLFDLDVERGQRVTAVVTATGFVPTIEAGTTSVLGFVPVLTSGYDETGTARIVINPFQSGKVTLRVRSTGLEAGQFELRVVPGVPTATE